MMERNDAFPPGYQDVSYKGYKIIMGARSEYGVSQNGIIVKSKFVSVDDAKGWIDNNGARKDAEEMTVQQRLDTMAEQVNSLGQAAAKVAGRMDASSGVRIVHNKLLGGWYVVRGPHQTPISGRFGSKEEAQAWLDSRKDSATGRMDASWEDSAKLIEATRDYAIWKTNSENGKPFIVKHGTTKKEFASLTEARNYATGLNSTRMDDWTAKSAKAVKK